MVNLFPHTFNLDIAFATSNLGPFFKNFGSSGIYYKCYILVKLTPEKESCVCIFRVSSSKYLKKLWQQIPLRLTVKNYNENTPYNRH